MTELPVVPACPDCTGVKWLYLGKLKNKYRCISCGREMTYAQLAAFMVVPPPPSP